MLIKFKIITIFILIVITLAETSKVGLIVQIYSVTFGAKIILWVMCICETKTEYCFLKDLEHIVFMAHSAVEIMRFVQ